MSEEKNVCPRCGACGCGGDDNSEQKPTEEKEQQKSSMNSREDFHFAILLALTPAMAMSLFNLMGLFSY